MTLEIDVITLFPEMIDGPLAASIPGRIQERGLATIRTHDLREWGIGRHRSVDDAPYGGGAGMVMRPEPIAAAIGELRRPDSLVILLDPGGETFRQARAHDLVEQSHLVLVCTRYEGVDERVRELVDLELSIGDYVLSGGEPAAVVVIDAVIRLLPGAIDDASTDEESFADGLLEYPQYTRPASFRGQDVPAVRRVATMAPFGSGACASPCDERSSAGRTFSTAVSRRRESERSSRSCARRPRRRTRTPRGRTTPSTRGSGSRARTR